MHVLGLDIGGANIKAATSGGVAASFPFAMWKDWEDLSAFLQTQIAKPFAGCDAVAVTMTGELCDCFDSKASGVSHILETLQDVFSYEKIQVYSVDGVFLDGHRANSNWAKVAASNWHALSSYATRYHDNPDELSLVIDLGSTSTDVIPISTRVEAVGTTDTTRIVNHELVYTGANRTPVCAVVDRFQFRNRHVVPAQEVFATMLDVYTILKDVREQISNFETADGRSQTIRNSKRRLARMVCADLCEISNDELVALARQAKNCQIELVVDAVQQQRARHQRPVTRLISAGSGEFLVRDLPRRFPELEIQNLNSVLGKSVCDSAPAFAVAKLFEELQC
jgi:probable H4MPT-linked C1 transfer pathway protein